MSNDSLYTVWLCRVYDVVREQYGFSHEEAVSYTEDYSWQAEFQLKMTPQEAVTQDLGEAV